MLRELHISNLAVIADATIEFASGFNCFTGQTGAGKSLVIGAVELLLGLRSPQGMLRAGAAEARVTGVFAIADAQVRSDIGALADLSLAQEPELILSRRIFASGRTSASLNGQPVSGQTLRQIGEMLADIHGQNDFQFLMRPVNQLAVLDQFAGVKATADEYRALHGRRAELLAQAAELSAGEELRRGQLELAEFQLAEIDALAPEPGEFDKLQERHKTLSNAALIKKQAAGITGELYDDEQSVIERLKRIFAALGDVAELAADFKPVFEQMRDAIISLDDAALSIRRIADRIEMDEEALAECSARLNEYNRLMHKYARRGGAAEELLDFQAQLQQQIETLKSEQAGEAECLKEIRGIESRLLELGKKLTAARRDAGARLSEQVCRQLAELGMKEARFEVALLPTGNDNDPYPSATGMETAEYLIAPNPGQPAQPLRQIASGGEISRVMLGLKCILSGVDRLSVLVFDEIDANVGGRMGLIIGDKLRQLASSHQVLCITHLPQIAAFAQRHLRIGKSVVQGNSYTQVETLVGEAVVDELAEMITGKQITPTARQQAQELLQLAAKASRSAVPKPGGKTPPSGKQSDEREKVSQPRGRTAPKIKAVRGKRP